MTKKPASKTKKTAPASAAQKKSGGKSGGSVADKHLKKFEAQYAETTEMWDNDEYDNYKDSLTDADELVDLAKKCAAAEQAKAEKFYQKVLKEAQSAAKKYPDIAKYLEGFV